LDPPTGVDEQTVTRCFVRCFVVVALGTGAISPVAAQSGATIAGRVVHKTTKAGIVGAEVRLAPSTRALVSDSAGHFRFDEVPPGTVSLLVRRLGFAPQSASFAVAVNDDLDVLVELQQVPQQLDTVSVAERQTPLVTGKLAGFYERKRFGIGKFIDSIDIERERGTELADVIALRTPGSKVVRANRGHIAWLATNRDSGIRPTGGVKLDPVDRLLGANPTACYPDVWLDGIKVYTFDSGMRLFDLSSLTTNDVAAIEVYVGAARIPIQYNTSNSSCGVLLIWTK
jgi:Carboxypeptidase regulatory-like domain